MLWLSTDRALHTDPGFSPHFMRYAVDQDAFFYDFSRFYKLSEGGAKFVTTSNITYNVQFFHLLLLITKSNVL